MCVCVTQAAGYVSGYSPLFPTAILGRFLMTKVKSIGTDEITQRRKYAQTILNPPKKVPKLEVTTATLCNTLQHTVTLCNTLQHTVTLCNTLQYSATLCITLQHTAAHCNTHCNTLSHIT